MGFFQKVSASDLFIVLDNVKFNKQYFQNRNKILTLEGKEEWITVQVEKLAPKKKINEVRVNWDEKWKRRLLDKIKKNLNFDATEFYSHEKLIDINMSGIRWAMERMKIDTPIIFSSALNVEGNKSSLNANLVRAAGGTKYISGPSGKDYLDMSYFDGIEVEYFHPQVDNYYSCLYNLL
tara:strand:- start:1177 stop:1713 length:537 start_codon:yes stop_codon:yes gene_type:complete